MKVFRLNHYQLDQDVFANEFYGTLAEAKKGAAEIPKNLRLETFGVEINVATDKAGVVAMLNGEPIVIEKLREFNVTARGSLKELS